MDTFAFLQSELAPRAGDHGSDFAAAQLVYSVMGIVARNLGR